MGASKHNVMYKLHFHSFGIASHELFHKETTQKREEEAEESASVVNGKGSLGMEATSLEYTNQAWKHESL